MPHGYFVALFDILGFERKLAEIGLPEMLASYEALIEVVNYRKEHIRRVFGDLGFAEAPHWTSEGSIFIFNEIRGAYASDSILLWMNRTWLKARGMTLEECNAQADDPAIGWTYQPIPCDNFFDVCNDIMCRSLRDWVTSQRSHSSERRRNTRRRETDISWATYCRGSSARKRAEIYWRKSMQKRYGTDDSETIYSAI